MIQSASRATFRVSVPCNVKSRQGEACPELVVVDMAGDVLTGYTAPCNHGQNPRRLRDEAARIHSTEGGDQDAGPVSPAREDDAGPQQGPGIAEPVPAADGGSQELRPPCPTRPGEARAIRWDNRSRTFTLVFPALPEGAVPLDVEPEFEDHTTHQPTGYVLHYDVPDPAGDRMCRTDDCPNCGGRVGLKDHGSDRGVHTTPEQAGSMPAPAEPLDLQDCCGATAAESSPCWCDEHELPAGHGIIHCASEAGHAKDAALRGGTR